jgi:hypothetical protein
MLLPEALRRFLEKASIDRANRIFLARVKKRGELIWLNRWI